MVFQSLLFLLFVHITLLVPGYALARRTGWASRHPGIELSLGYFFTITFFFLLALTGYVLGVGQVILQIIGWLGLLAGGITFIRNRYYRDLWSLRLPLLCLLLMSVFASLFLSLSFNSKYTFLPDPQPQSNRNYNVLAVKVLNVSDTQANDNSVPYRQAQFFINRSDPGKDSFIDEWGVHFFQRTPLMGGVTATYLNLLGDKPPIAYIWSNDAPDPSHTYQKFQIISHALNSLFIVPAFFLLAWFFKRKVAAIACLFMVTSQFFLYNAVFSWPKSFVAFFVLVSWLMLLENRFRYTLLAAPIGGAAYLAHDLAVMYIGAAVLLLLLYKRFRDAFIYVAPSLLFIATWLSVATLLYKKPSSFILYPISIDGIPQPDRKSQIISQFFDTSPLRLAYIRITNFVYLLSPYQLLTSEGGQSLLHRLWALGIFSIPGGLGIGLIVPALLGAIKRFGGWPFWILAITPVILETLIIGWPKGLGALHFAQVVVVLLTGVAILFLARLKQQRWLIAAYMLNAVHLSFFVAYSFDFNVDGWLTSPGDLASLALMLTIVAYCGGLVRAIATGRKSWINP